MQRTRGFRLRHAAVVLLATVALAPVWAQTITFGGWSGEEEAARPVIMEMIDTFNAANPGVTVEWLGYPWAQVQQNFLLLLRSGNAPQVAQLQDRWLSTFGALGALADMNDVFGQELIESRIAPGLLTVGQYEGQQLGLPWIAGSIGLVANLKVLEDAGVAELPATVDEFVAALRAIKATDPNSIPFAITTQGNATISTDFQVWLWTFGGNLFDAEGNVTAASPEAQEALSFLKGLIDDGLAALEVGRGDARQLFARHQAAFYFDAPVAKGIARNNAAEGAGFDAFIAPMATPTLAAGDRSYQTAWGHLLVLFQPAGQTVTADSPAARFVSHLVLDPSWPTRYFEALALLPSNTEATMSASFQADPYAVSWLDIAARSARVDEAALWPNSPQMTDAIGEEVQSVYLGQKTPERALQDLQRRLEALVAEVR
jgi:multiple sugar transport system substrate-binding protein